MEAQGRMRVGEHTASNDRGPIPGDMWPNGLIAQVRVRMQLCILGYASGARGPCSARNRLVFLTSNSVPLIGGLIGSSVLTCPNLGISIKFTTDLYISV